MERDDATVADEVVARLREICGKFPEAYEERAWVGTRWRIRTKTFAHVLVVVDGRPESYARAVGRPAQVSGGPKAHGPRGVGRVDDREDPLQGA